MIYEFFKGHAMYDQKASATQARQIVPRIAEADSRLSQVSRGLLASLGFAAFFCVSATAQAATAPSLGSTSTFGVVSSTFTNSNTGLQTNITGDVCYTTPPTTSPMSITGATVTPCNTQIGDQGSALVGLDSQLPSCLSLGTAVDLSSAVVGGGTPGVIPPGCYSSTGAMSIGSTVTLSGSGVYIFRPGAGTSAAALSTAANSIVTLNGACATDVFWAPTSATTLGANSTFVGTIIDAAGISIGHFATLTGRALAAGGTVTTDANTITVPSACAVPVLPTITVTKISNGGVGTFNFTGTNGLANQSIITSTAGVGVTGATQTLTAAGTSTTITESAPPAGYSLASIACTGLGSGGTATPNIVARNVTLDAAATAAGSTIACTFNNTFSVVPPIVTPGTAIPTLSEWAMVLLAALLAIAGFAAMRRQAR